MSDTPRVSIGLPVYNGGRYLAPAIESILAQTFGDFELIIGDNASTDGTEEVCRRFAAQDARIIYVRRPENVGGAGNYNDLFHRSRGEFFRWAAHDDLLAPRLIERCVAALDSAPPSVVLAYPRTVLIDAEGRRLRDHADNMDIREEFPYQRLVHVVKSWSMCNPIFGLMRREALARTGLNRKFASSDVVLLCEMAMLGEFWEVPEALFLRRMHPGTSRNANVSALDIARWFDPTVTHMWSFPHPRTRLFFHVIAAAWRFELPLAERVRCVATTTQAWWWRRMRIRGGALRRRFTRPRELERGV